MGAIAEHQLQEALAFQRNRQLKIGEALIALNHCDEATVAKALAKQHGLPFVDLGKGKIAQALIQKVPANTALEYEIVPLMERNGKLLLAVDDPLKSFLSDSLQFLFGSPVEFALASPSALRKALATYYQGEKPSAAETNPGKKKDTNAVDEVEGDDAPIVRLVQKTFADALQARASDIHVEPFASRVRVRYRVDGMLREVDSHPKHLQAPLLSRLKIMAGMDIAEKRKPQDGRIGMRLDGREIDVRASILPGNHGESAVLRLLDKEKSLISLADLGFDSDNDRRFRQIIKRPNGIVLVTGPTGSGKTTTLYAALSELNRPDVKIITAEDPIEYHLRGINQVQVKTQIGLSFARILRAMLRQAPNIILVGEIRDRETAEIAIQAALTGHLVFSTLHTNDAPSAVTRLIDMGVKPFLVAASLQAVISQRLIRTICSDCKEGYSPTASELRVLNLKPSDVKGKKFMRGRGCPGCHGQGYRGRKGIFEMMEMDRALAELVYQNSPAFRIREQAKNSGKLSVLFEDGLRKVLAGESTIEEILRVTQFAEPANEENEAVSFAGS